MSRKDSIDAIPNDATLDLQGSFCTPTACAMIATMIEQYGCAAIVNGTTADVAPGVAAYEFGMEFMEYLQSKRESE